MVKLHKGIGYFCARALGLHNYTSNAISGEIGAIALGLDGKSAPTVFDVGANEGEWVARVLSRNRSARVHAFEPQAALAAKIATRHPGVIVNNMGLGDVAGTLELGDYAEHPGSQHASMLKGVIDGLHRGRVRYVEVPVGTIDDYCALRTIESIDLLKIDVEGFELKVLQGASRMLREGRIETIQFEFNEMNILARAFLNDFFGCLEATHRLYRLLPHGRMPLRSGAHWTNEQFTFQNIVAVRNTSRALPSR